MIAPTITTPAAQATGVGLDVERRADCAILAPASEADGLSNHLLFAHAHAESAEYAVLVFLTEPLLQDLVL